MLALPQGMLGREACVYVRASSAMLGRAGLMVRQVGPARNRCACASLSRAASHTSGAYPFVLSRRAVRVVDVRCFARKLIEEVEEYPVFPHVMTSKSPFAKLGIKLPSPGTRLRSVRWRSVSSGRSCQDRATVQRSLFTVPLVRARRHHLGGSGSKLCALLQHPRALGWSAAVLECRRCG